MLGLLVLIAVFAPLLSSYAPERISLSEELLAPSLAHPLGCDANGGDIWSIIVHGARISLFVGLAATCGALFAGLVIGSIAGWRGGWIDNLLMRALDIVFAFPGLILAIALAAVLGPSVGNVALALMLTGWAGYARLVRGEVRHLRTQEFVQAAEALGLPSWRIVVRHIWPNLFSPLAVSTSFGLAGCVLAEASLSFLGVGVPPGTPSWGSLLNFGKDVLVEAPHVAGFPGLAIAYTVFAFQWLGEGLRERLDPRSSV